MKVLLSGVLSLLLISSGSAQSTCGWNPDVDTDYQISIMDILAILGVFGQVDSDQDGIWDDSDLCVDLTACNYLNDPSEACLFEDASGVCGGSGVFPELLVGSWAMSTAAGAVEVGPAAGSNEWYSSESGGLQSAQYDDVYTFEADGSLTTHYNGSIIDAFQGYSEVTYTCSSSELNFTPGSDSGEIGSFELTPGTGACSCPFIGTTDGGLVYDIVSLTDNTLILQTQGDNVNCNPAELYFTYVLTRIDTGNDDETGEGYPAADSYPGMTLVWSDEFDGNAINSSNWTHELGASGWGNNEWQNYTNSPSNSSVSDGFLTITARQEGSGYTSARLKSEDLQEFQYGRIDVRAKLPEGQGIWPAIWMLGGNFAESGWPSCGEIDIMELIGNLPSTTHGTAHWGSSFNVHQYTGNSITLSGGEQFSDAFHLFSVEWEANQISWLMDDVEFFSINSSQMNGQPYPFNQPFFFIFNIAVGGNWPGYPDASTSFPQEMTIDCIRVFQ